MSMTRMEIILAIQEIRRTLIYALDDETYDRQTLAEETLASIEALEDRA